MSIWITVLLGAGVLAWFLPKLLSTVRFRGSGLWIRLKDRVPTGWWSSSDSQLTFVLVVLTWWVSAHDIPSALLISESSGRVESQFGVALALTALLIFGANQIASVRKEADEAGSYLGVRIRVFEYTSSRASSLLRSRMFRVAALALFLVPVVGVLSRVGARLPFGQYSKFLPILDALWIACVGVVTGILVWNVFVVIRTASRALHSVHHLRWGIEDALSDETDVQTRRLLRQGEAGVAEYDFMISQALKLARGLPREEVAEYLSRATGTAVLSSAQARITDVLLRLKDQQYARTRVVQWAHHRRASQALRRLADVTNFLDVRREKLARELGHSETTEAVSDWIIRQLMNDLSAGAGGGSGRELVELATAWALESLDLSVQRAVQDIESIAITANPNGATPWGHFGHLSIQEGSGEIERVPVFVVNTLFGWSAPSLVRERACSRGLLPEFLAAIRMIRDTDTRVFVGGVAVAGMFREFDARSVADAEALLETASKWNVGHEYFVDVDESVESVRDVFTSELAGRLIRGRMEPGKAMLLLAAADVNDLPLLFLLKLLAARRSHGGVSVEESGLWSERWERAFRDAGAIEIPSEARMHLLLVTASVGHFATREDLAALLRLAAEPFGAAACARFHEFRERHRRLGLSLVDYVHWRLVFFHRSRLDYQSRVRGEDGQNAISNRDRADLGHLLDAWSGVNEENAESVRYLLGVEAVPREQGA